jgi:hypothetical protein
MSDAQNIKLKYKRGTCFGCRKCLYCGVDLQQQRCNCDVTKPPTRKNRTANVKFAFTRIFNPDNWMKVQISFIQEKVLKYNYSLDLKKPFNLSLCSRCNNNLSRLVPTKVKKQKISKSTSDLEEIKDLTTSKAPETLESEEDTNSTDSDFEYEFQYGVFIKLNGKLQPAKWYKVTVSEIDEFLAEIHVNVVALTQDESIEACDYNVTFKSEKSSGAGTQLADAQDFKRFCSEYCKLSQKNVNMGIFITIKSQDLNKKKRKKVFI